VHFIKLMIFAGDISAIYIGATTDEAPTPIPPRKRNIINELTSAARALPTAVMTYNAAIAKRMGFLPYRSAGLQEINAPVTVPINAEEIAKPCLKDDS